MRRSNIKVRVLVPKALFNLYFKAQALCLEGLRCPKLAGGL